MRDIDPTDPYLLDVVDSAIAFAAEKEKLLHGQSSSIDDAKEILKISILRAVRAWQRRPPRLRSTFDAPLSNTVTQKPPPPKV